MSTKEDVMPHRGPPYVQHVTPWQWRFSAAVIWVGIILLIASGVAIIAGRINRDVDFSPLGGPLYAGDPIAAIPDRVRAGGSVTVTIDRCLHSDESIRLFSSLRWQSVDNDALPPVAGGSTFTEQEPGCHHSDFAVDVPVSLTPGRWQLAGIDGALANTASGIQVRTWETVPVEVYE